MIWIIIVLLSTTPVWQDAVSSTVYGSWLINDPEHWISRQAITVAINISMIRHQCDSIQCLIDTMTRHVSDFTMHIKRIHIL